MLRKSIGFLAVLGLVAVAGPASAQTVKLGYVDLQKALTSVEDGKAAKAKLEKLVKAKQVEFDKMQDDLKKLKDELEQQAAIMKDDLKRQKIQDYQRRLMELQEYYLGNQKELAEQEAKLTKPIFDRFEKILKKIGKDDSYTLIVEKAAAVYATASIDVTDRLIREYNAGGGK